jgi:flavodoxin
MNAMVVYDSFFGNTEQIARAIANALGGPEEDGIRRVGDVKRQQLTGLDLLIVGSPTRGARPSPAISAFLKGIPRDGLRGVSVAAFDTRVTEEEIASGPGILRLFVKLLGYAANPIADQLVKRGGALLVSPEGFFVHGREGPLQDGELERAAKWAKTLVNTR